ncbi:MAG: TonB family protein [Bdellovibrionales bacterium]
MAGKRNILIKSTLVFGITLALGAGVYWKLRQDDMRRSQLEIRHQSQEGSEDPATAQKRIVLQEAVLSQRNEIEVCYDEYLAREPGRPNGSVSVQWDVEESGQVANLRVAQAELSDPDLHECLIEQIRQMTFDPEKVEVPTQYSYRFHFKARAPASVTFE